MSIRMAATLLISVFLTFDCLAQRPDGPPPQSNRPQSNRPLRSAERPDDPGPPDHGSRGGGRGKEERGPGEPPVNPLMEVLDTDRNGVLSISEIAAASRSLEKLDKDGDGKLSDEELRPAPANRGRREGPGARPRSREGQRNGRGNARGRRGPPRNGPRPFGARVYAERILAFDENGDSYVSRHELPERMVPLIDRADSDNDGKLEEDEIMEYVRNLGDSRGSE